MTYQLVIFDLDGTLLDTLEDLADSTNYALGFFGYPTRTIDEIRSFVGNGIRKLIERSVPDGTDSSMTDKVLETFKAHYKLHCADKTKPYDKIIALLMQLRANGLKTAVVSNKADFAVKNLCNQYFSGLLDEAVGERTGIARKPAPDTVNEVLKKLGIDREKAVYIGDSDVDIATADNAYMNCIAVDWGFRSTEELKKAGASLIVSSPEQIAELVLYTA